MQAQSYTGHTLTDMQKWPFAEGTCTYMYIYIQVHVYIVYNISRRFYSRHQKIPQVYTCTCVLVLS